MRDPPRPEDKICSENTVVLRKVTLIKAKRNIFQNYSPWTLPRKNFCVSRLSIYCFSLFSYHPQPIKGVVHFIEIQFFSPLSTNLLYLALWVLIHSSFGPKSYSPPLQISFIIPYFIHFILISKPKKIYMFSLHYTFLSLSLCTAFPLSPPRPDHRQQ